MTVTAMPKGEEEQETKKRKPIKLIAFLLVLVVAAAAGYFLVLAPKGKKDEAPKPGAVLALDSQQINLAAGHYLRLGVALQLTAKAPEEVDGSKALDAAIGIFSGLSVEQVTKTGARDALKKKLLTDLEHRYEDEVMDVYFTEFVTQ
ncbi:flagellar basal body-associated FliL family protein [Nocardioides sp. CER19]|uniref:flagellar basal body-associated FliL family protein n=1 Tax=Nocardioides sp. CER19 TaxID=3038538 RepID=UPI00244A110C|nr:flagellar basal body-associated FliL family protein [Nocardioides sp. CER19]MDH2414619.1 flagellar basal body-associated FliL family protein [Nocardioides sp. CER19]